MRTLEVCLLCVALALTSTMNMPASAQTPNVAAGIGTQIESANTRPPGLKGHSFDGNEQPLVDTLAGWLAAQGL